MNSMSNNTQVYDKVLPSMDQTATQNTFVTFVKILKVQSFSVLLFVAHSPYY